MVASRKLFNVPADLFNEHEEPTASEPTELERFLKRKRDPETGNLVPRRKRSSSIAASTFDRTLVETQEMMEAREWTGCTARHLVALYDLMHEKTYGFEVTMSGTERYRYTMIAGAFVKRNFAGDFVQAIEFFRWVWTREIDREKWRRENDRDGGHIGLGFMFSNRLFDQWRLAMARAHARTRVRSNTRTREHR